MRRLGVIGANGQVGAELCMLLAARKDIELVPICRNRSGSAFLRWHGIACRHGRVTDPADAVRLLSDCDMIVNSSLASGTPSQIRETEDQIIRNIFRYSGDSTTVIHLSTQSVYGDPRPGRRVRRLNPYGRAKLASERSVRSAARQTGKRTYILRLGHVCGALQEISNSIRSEIRAGRVILPAQDRSSNTVYTAAILEAFERIAADEVEPGTYDLMNTPRWTWQQVYGYEAGVYGLPLRPLLVESPSDSARSSLGARALGPMKSLLGAQPLRDLSAKMFAHMPESINARATGWWYVRRAGAEIAGLAIPVNVPEHLSWVENGESFFPAATPTLDLLRSACPLLEASSGAGICVADLPDAQPLLSKGSAAACRAEA